MSFHQVQISFESFSSELPCRCIAIHHGTAKYLYTCFFVDVSQPEITCPADATFGNDAGKDYKTITLPEPPAAKDNSGKTPTITTSIGKTQHQFSIQSKTHEVVYTARDEAGLTAQCTWFLTIKGESF